MRLPEQCIISVNVGELHLSFLGIHGPFLVLISDSFVRVALTE